ncbi:MAG: histidine phosphatase family protein [Planctomycetales bacterium]|nr:histidine phosphatase family protein [Planctomycetales bacterium]
MLRILLVRPGATEYDKQGRIQGTLDIPLCEDGRHQVAAICPDLQAAEPAAIYTSPCESCEQTAELISEPLDLRPKTVEKLKNLDHGLWQGMLIEDVKTKQPKVYRQWREQPETVCPPQGETVLAAKARVADVLRKVLKKHKSHKAVVIVAPEPLLSVVRHVLLLNELSDLWKPAAEGATWEAIEAPEVLLEHP